MAAYGLYSHIQSNRRRSIALLIGLFFLIYVMVYAGALVAEALSYNAPLDVLTRRAWNDLIGAAPFATIGTALWVVIAYFFHQSMIDAATAPAMSPDRSNPGFTTFWKISASRAASPCRRSRSWIAMRSTPSPPA